MTLFSGVGMDALALQQHGFDIVATAEIDAFDREVLKARFPDGAHFSNVTSIHAADFPEDKRPTLISGGFPCQDVSSAGTGQGLNGRRSGLWLEFKRIISEFEPKYVMIENVALLRKRGLDAILNDLHHLGYDAWWDCIPAAHVGAPHLRDRMFIGAVRQHGEVFSDGKRADMIGSVGREGNGVIRQQWEPVTDLPRAGKMMRGVLIRTRPQAPIGESRREALRWHGSLLPTPTRADGTGGPGTTPKRTGGKNLRTVAAELEGNGRLNPEFVEWMMGLPAFWTDPGMPNSLLIEHAGWDLDYAGKTTSLKRKNRTQRIKALGNGLVPQAYSVMLEHLLRQGKEEWTACDS